MTEIEQENFIYSILDKYDKYTNIVRIYDILQDYFGENNVNTYQIFTMCKMKRILNSAPDDANLEELIIGEYNKCSINDAKRILIKFPSIKITNEKGSFHIINDIYIKLRIFNTGEMIDGGGISICKTTFTKNELSHRYIHSHAPRLNLSSNNQFYSMCLGIGPIKQTLRSLQHKYDENLWELLCVELKQYLQTESLLGGPYIRLDSLYNDGDGQVTLNDKITGLYIPTDVSTIYKAFTKYIIRNKLLKTVNVLNFTEVAMSPTIAILYISKLFYEWIIQNYVHCKFTYNLTDDCPELRKCFIDVVLKNGKIYYRSNQQSTFERFNNFKTKKVLTFNGENIFYKLNDTDVNPEKRLYVLHPLFIKKLIQIYITYYSISNKLKYNEETNETNRTNETRKQYKLCL